jgi:glutaredoxin
MAQVEIIVFVLPSCPWCQNVEQVLLRTGLRFTTIDVTSSWTALRALLRHAGMPVVPTVVAYGEVMVGFDEARLKAMLEGVQARADAFEASEAEQEALLSASDQAVRRALGPEADRTVAELMDDDESGVG